MSGFSELTLRPFGRLRTGKLRVSGEGTFPTTKTAFPWLSEGFSQRRRRPACDIFNHIGNERGLPLKLKHTFEPDIGNSAAGDDSHLPELLHRVDAVVAASFDDSAGRGRADAGHPEKLLVSGFIDIDGEEPGLFLGNGYFWVFGQRQIALCIQGQLYLPGRKTIN